MSRPIPKFKDGEPVILVNDSNLAIKGHAIVGDPIWVSRGDPMLDDDGKLCESPVTGWRYETTFELGGYIAEFQIRKLPPAASETWDSLKESLSSRCEYAKED